MEGRHSPTAARRYGDFSLSGRFSIVIEATGVPLAGGGGWGALQHAKAPPQVAA